MDVGEAVPRIFGAGKTHFRSCCRGRANGAVAFPGSAPGVDCLLISKGPSSQPSPQSLCLTVAIASTSNVSTGLAARFATPGSWIAGAPGRVHVGRLCCQWIVTVGTVEGCTVGDLERDLGRVVAEHDAGRAVVAHSPRAVMRFSQGSQSPVAQHG